MKKRQMRQKSIRNTLMKLTLMAIEMLNQQLAAADDNDAFEKCHSFLDMFDDIQSCLMNTTIKVELRMHSVHLAVSRSMDDLYLEDVLSLMNRMLLNSVD